MKHYQGVGDPFGNDQRFAGGHGPRAEDRFSRAIGGNLLFLVLRRFPVMVCRGIRGGTADEVRRPEVVHEIREDNSASEEIPYTGPGTIL